MDDILKTSILSQYLRQAALSMSGVITSRDSYQFKCNICGDGSKLGNKRGHLRLYRTNGTQYWTYKCFNDGCRASGNGEAWPGELWLKHTSPYLYDNYVADLLSENKKDYSEEIKKLEEKVAIEQRIVRQEKHNKEQKALEYFIPITDNNKLCKTAIDLCVNRFIPEEVWSKFFVALPGKGSVYSNRMIIPFYDNNDEIYYWQGRSLLEKQDPKYLNRLTDKHEAIYNIFNIDKTKPVFITEGPIDSIFIENGIATLGLEVSEKMQSIINTFDNVIYVFDGDKPGIKTAQKYIEKGKKVFLWEKFIKELNLPTRKKWDINDFIIFLGLKDTKLTFNDLERFISKNFYDALWL